MSERPGGPMQAWMLLYRLDNILSGLLQFHRDRNVTDQLLVHLHKRSVANLTVWINLGGTEG
jgi:hypothetical protein